MAVTRPYRGRTADERRGDRRRALIDAVVDVLLVDGLAGVSVRSVCARAQLTPRYFYEGFADLDALLVAAVDQVVDEVARASVSGVRAAPARDVAAQVRAAIGAGYGVVADDPRKANMILVAAAGHGVLRARRHRLVTDFADLVLDTLTIFEQLGPTDRRSARATALFLMGGSTDVIEAVLSGRLSMTTDEVVDHLTALWLGALGVVPR